MTIESQGTVSVVNGNFSIAGSGTAFVAKAVTDGVITVNGISAHIESVQSENIIRLSSPWAGPTSSDQNYFIQLENADAGNNVTLLNRVTENLFRLRDISSLGGTFLSKITRMEMLETLGLVNADGSYVWGDPNASGVGRSLLVNFSGSITTTGNETKVSGWSTSIDNDFGADWNPSTGVWTASENMTILVFGLINLAGAPSGEAVRIKRNAAVINTLGNGLGVPYGTLPFKVTAGQEVSLWAYSTAGAGQTINFATLSIVQMSN